jgi:cytidyltransferase-like protein
MNNNKNIIILPGSFKPPHKGHLSLIENIIKKYNNSKIYIIISSKSRALNSRFQYYENMSKEDLQNSLIEYFPKQKKNIMNLSKNILLKKIREYIEKKKIDVVDAYVSLKIWNIYIKYLKKKLKKQNKKFKFPQIIFIISKTNNVIVETTKVMFEALREKPKKIFLMKSLKNKNNKRFDFILKRFNKYINEVLFPNIKDIDAKDMRKAILKNNYKNFIEYLPEYLSNTEKKKIWKIVKK